jgi:hypothetical protein
MKNGVTTHKGHHVDGAVVGAGSLFGPGATMELSPLENHAEYCIQIQIIKSSDPISVKIEILRLTHNPILLNIESKGTFLLFHRSSKILINLADPITNLTINSLS